MPKDSFDLKKGKVLAPWFISIPTPDGRIHLPLRMAKEHCELLDKVQLCDSLIVKRGDRFYVHLVVEREVPDPIIPSQGPILAVDIGERVIATSVALVDGSPCEPRFHGRRVRGIRRHYAWLRRRLGERKLLRVIKRVGQAEGRKVMDELHKAAKSIVDQASMIGPTIALGDLFGLRSRSTKGKRLRRIVNAMPYARLASLIEYKAAWAGVPVIRVREDYTSRECRLCHEWGRRPSQGRFICPTCGEYNADLNGPVNIGERALAYMAMTGAPGFEPERHAWTCQVPRMEQNPKQSHWYHYP